MAGAETATSAPRIGAGRIVLMLLALMIALPAFVTGAELAHAMGGLRAGWASLGGGLLLGLVASLAGAAGARHRATTYELIAEAFGLQGARGVNAVLGLTMLGWFGVVATMFGDALASVAPALAQRFPSAVLVLAGGAVTTVTIMVGFRALDWLSALTTPLKLGLLVWAFAAALGGGTDAALAYQPAQPMALGAGISTVAGGLIVGASLSPDICRFARSPRAAALGCVAAYGVGFPAILIMAGLPSLATGDRDLVRIMLGLGLGVPAMLTVLLAAWSNNSFNLYATTLVGATLRPATPPWLLTLLAGTMGTALGLVGISQWLIPYLVWLSVLIPPVAGVYLVRAWTVPALGSQPVAWRWSAFAAWLAGSLWAQLAPRWGWQLSPVPALDALLVSAGIAGLVHWRSLTR